VGTYDVAVIGAGIIGSSIACELASAGVSVVVLDRQQPAREASWAAAGMLTPGPDAPESLPLVPLAQESLRLHPGFVAGVEAASGRSCDYATEGTQQVFHGSHAEAERDAFVALHHSLGIEAEPVVVEAARRMEPALGPEARAVAWLPDEATVDPRLLSEATVAAAAQRGAQIRRDCAVSSLARTGERCTGVVAGGERIGAKHVVLAAGAFSGALAPTELAADAAPGGDATTAHEVTQCAPTHPVRGQMVALRSESVRLRRVLRSDRGYLVPRRDGRIIAGSTLEDAGFEKRVTAAGLHQILSAAFELAPSLAGAEVVETWSGLRPGTPDGLPIIGASDVEGLLIATGHYRNGIVLAPVTAKLITQIILHGQVERELAARVEFENFSPLRFLSRKASHAPKSAVASS